MAVKVLIVDDQAAFRTAAREVVAATAGFEFAGEAVSGEDSVAAARRLHPDLVLMDVRLPGVDGLEASRRIRSEQDGITVFHADVGQNDVGTFAVDGFRQLVEVGARRKHFDVIQAAHQLSNPLANDVRSLRGSAIRELLPSPYSNIRVRSSRSGLVALELSFSSGKSAVQLFLNSWSYGPFWPISISAAEHLITKQLLCQLSYAGVV